VTSLKYLGLKDMSDEEVVLKDLPERKVVYVQCKGSWRQLPDMLASLSEYASQSGLDTVGPPSGFYHNTPGEVAIEELSWEVCFAVKPNISERADDKLKSGVREIPATRVAAIIHKGSYRKASPSYEKLQGWIKAHGLKVCGPAEELYLTDINKTNEEQRIEIRLPICAA
jgi:effector-binding domain-containing protein